MQLKFEEIKHIQLPRFFDNRGYFSETYNISKLRKMGIESDFVQDNHSLSNEKGTLRGMHFQSPPFAQEKLIRCIRGSIFDVVVDVRKGSQSYGNWKGYELSSKKGNQLFIPTGFAHGFVTLSKNSEIIYKCSNYYAPEMEYSINWNDPNIGIQWPLKTNPILSEKDRNAPLLKNIESPFIFGENS